MRAHGPGPGVKTWQTDKQADRRRRNQGGGGQGVLFPKDVSDCLAGRVSTLDWRNQVDRKQGSG